MYDVPYSSFGALVTSGGTGLEGVEWMTNWMETSEGCTHVERYSPIAHVKPSALLSGQHLE